MRIGRLGLYCERNELAVYVIPTVYVSAMAAIVSKNRRKNVTTVEIGLSWIRWSVCANWWITHEGDSPPALAILCTRLAGSRPPL
jgi:hypothetical protein